jgi:hypothetical protein
MSGWGCPHEVNGNCRKVDGKKCDPGMKGCTLSGKFRFSSSEKNISRHLKREADSESGNDPEKG